MTKARDLADLLDSNGNLIAKGVVDGRDLATDGSKLDGIEAGATADQDHSEIRALIDIGVDTNVFTDADHTKLDGIEASATADQTDAEIRAAVEAATDSNVFTDADHTKLNAIEAGATADQTKSDIDALNINADTLDGQHGSYYTGYTDTAVANIVDSSPAALNTLNELAAALGDDPNFATTTSTNIGTKLPKSGGAMTGAITTNSTFDGRNVSVDGAKLDGIEAGANVTDTANVVAALTAGSNITIASDGTIAGAAQYTHPTHAGDDASIDTGALSGATVISDLDFNITTDTLGHVTDANATVSTRNLTLANLGYTGETNATADQTAAQLLTAVKTVDGSGSGLDADLLDGVQGSSYLRSDTSDSFSGNLTSASANWIKYYHSSQTDSNDGKIGSGIFASGLNIVGTQTTGGTGRQVRIWGDVLTDSGNKFWNAGNDGSGSGLDADLLDGQHASSFQLTDNTLLKQGGDITSQNWDDYWNGTEASWNTVLNASGSHRPPAYTYGTALSFGKSGQAQFQLYAPENGSNGEGLRYRTSWNNASRPWVELWDSGNDGAGSGLDADLLDGQQGSSYLRSNTPDTISATNIGPILTVSKTGSAPGNGAAQLVYNQYGNHSWGITSEFRNGSAAGADRPSILFSSEHNTDTWSVGFGSSDSDFRINQDHGHRNQSWGTTRLRIDRSGVIHGDGSGLTNLPAGLPYTAQSLATNGYIKLAGGLIIQWGRSGATSYGDIFVSFPTTFPSACSSFTSTMTGATGSDNWVNGFSVLGHYTTGVSVRCRTDSGGAGITWMAIGY